jgi:hypothetical protein
MSSIDGLMQPSATGKPGTWAETGRSQERAELPVLRANDAA